MYIVATQTGLRAGELRSLTRSSFDLDGDPPTVMVAAGYSKRRREDVLPLRTEMVEVLRTHLANKAPAAAALRMPAAHHQARMLRADLEAARGAWIKDTQDPKDAKQRLDSTFLQYRDDSGRVADFHALRHTFITNLAQSGVHPKRQ